MGYLLLYMIQGSDSVSGPYICRGAHPPPRRHQPRLPAKLTHNHATGFSRRPCRGSLLGRPLLRYPGLANDWTVTVHTWHTCKSLVTHNVYYFFKQLRKKGRELLWGRGAKIHFHHMCVLVAHKEETRRVSGLANRGYVSYRETMIINFKRHGINFNSLAGLMFFYVRAYIHQFYEEGAVMQIHSSRR